MIKRTMIRRGVFTGGEIKSENPANTLVDRTFPNDWRSAYVSDNPTNQSTLRDICDTSKRNQAEENVFSDKPAAKRRRKNKPRKISVKPRATQSIESEWEEKLILTTLTVT